MSYDDKPNILGDTINKKPLTKDINEMRYESGNISQENREFVKSVINDIYKSKVHTGYSSYEGYDGTPIIKDIILFEKEYPCLSWKSPDLLYDKMMNDARNVFPRNIKIKLSVNEYYTDMIKINLNNIYNYAPRFFTDNFISSSGVNNAAFEAYQVYIYLLCFIQYTYDHRNDIDIRELDNIDLILNWIITRRDPSIEYIISGPTVNSNLCNVDFREHYKTLISPSNDMTNIIQYNQLSTTQTISSDIYTLMTFLRNNPNVYIKTPDEARKYNVNIDSSRDVMVTIDNDNNLIFNCNRVNLGDTTEQNKLAKYNNLESIITNNIVDSMINTRKLAEIFHNYSRLKILEFVISADTYITSLDVFNKIFIVFKGVSCSERNVYNNIPTNYLKIGGSFKRTSRGYEFVQDVDAITYKSVLADVKSFEIYLTLDPSSENVLIPNEYILSFTKDKVFQHPVETGITFNSNKITLQSFEPDNMITHNAIIPTFNSNIKTIHTSDIDTIKPYIFHIKDNSSLRLAIEKCIELNTKLISNLNNEHKRFDTVIPYINKFSNLLHMYLDKLNALDDEYKYSITKTHSEYEELNDILNIITSGDNNGSTSGNVYSTVSTIRELRESFNPMLILNIYNMLTNKIDPNWNTIEMQSVDKNLIQTSLESISNELSITAFTTAITEFLTKYDQMTTTLFRTHYYIIMDTINPYVQISNKPYVNDFDELYKLLTGYDRTLSTLIRMTYDKLDATTLEITKRHSYKNMFVDITTGKINGKYFRVDSNGNVRFVNTNGSEYTTPDENYIMYSNEENDLMLYNLYKYYNNTLDPIKNGTFLYSSKLNTIQNLSYNLLSYDKANGLMRFDNIYNLVCFDGTEQVLTVYPDNMVLSDELANNKNVKQWRDIVDMYNDESYTYYKTVKTITPANAPGTSTTEYSYIEINNRTGEIKFDDTNNGTLSNNINTILGATQAYLTHTYTDEDGNTINEVCYKKYTGVIDISFYYKYYDKIIVYEYLDDYNIINTGISGENTLTNPSSLNGNNLTFTTQHGLLTDDQNEIKLLNAKCTVNGNDSICTIIKSNGTYKIYGVSYNNDVPTGIINAYSANITKTNNNVNGLDTYSGTVNGNIHNSAYGKLDSITLTDVLGNKFTLNITQGNVILDIHSDYFKKLDELIDSLIVSINTTDTTVTKKYVKYTYSNDSVIIDTVKSKTDNNEYHDILIIDIANVGIFKYTYTKNNTIQNEEYNTLVYSCKNINEQFINNVIVNSDLTDTIPSYSINIDLTKSNCYKAFEINGYDIMNNYWNINTYAGSIMLCPLPINTNLIDAMIPNNADNADNIFGIGNITYDSSSYNTFLYNYDGGKMISYDGIFVITKDDICRNENGILKSSGLNSLYVSNTGFHLSYGSTSDTISEDRDEHLITPLWDANNGELTDIIMYTYNKRTNPDCIRNVRVTTFINTVMYNTNTNEYVNVSKPITFPVAAKVYSNVPVYFEDKVLLVQFNVYVDTGKTYFAVSYAAVYYTEYFVKRYEKINGRIKEQLVPTIKYTNINDKIIEQNERFALNISMQTYKLYPNIRYFENSFVSPKYVDTNNRYITIANKYNQNTITEPVYVYGQYSNNSDNVRIGNKIDPYSTYTLESINQDYIMLGGINKIDNLSDIAIRSNEIFVVPSTTKMLMSLEFS